MNIITFEYITNLKREQCYNCGKNQKYNYMLLNHKNITYSLPICHTCYDSRYKDQYLLQIIDDNRLNDIIPISCIEELDKLCYDKFIIKEKTYEKFMFYENDIDCVATHLLVKKDNKIYIEMTNLSKTKIEYVLLTDLIRLNNIKINNITIFASDFIITNWQCLYKLCNYDT